MPIDNNDVNRFFADPLSAPALRLYGESALANLLRSSTLTDTTEFLCVFNAIQEDLNHVFAHANNKEAVIKLTQQLAQLSDTDFSTQLANQKFHDHDAEDTEIKRRLTQLHDRMHNKNNATRSLIARLPAGTDTAPIQQQIQHQVARYCQGVEPVLLIINSLIKSKVDNMTYLQCCAVKAAIHQLANPSHELGGITQMAMIDLLKVRIKPTTAGETDSAYAHRVATAALQKINGRLSTLKKPQPNYRYNYLSSELEDLRTNLSQHTNAPREAPLEWTRGITRSQDGPRYDSVQLAVYSGKKEIGKTTENQDLFVHELLKYVRSKLYVSHYDPNCLNNGVRFGMMIHLDEHFVSIGLQCHAVDNAAARTLATLFQTNPALLYLQSDELLSDATHGATVRRALKALYGNVTACHIDTTDQDWMNKEVATGQTLRQSLTDKLNHAFANNGRPIQLTDRRRPFHQNEVGLTCGALSFEHLENYLSHGNALTMPADKEKFKKDVLQKHLLASEELRDEMLDGVEFTSPKNNLSTPQIRQNLMAWWQTNYAARYGDMQHDTTTHHLVTKVGGSELTFSNNGVSITKLNRHNLTIALAGFVEQHRNARGHVKNPLSLYITAPSQKAAEQTRRAVEQYNRQAGAATTIEIKLQKVIPPKTKPTPSSGSLPPMPSFPGMGS